MTDDLATPPDPFFEPTAAVPEWIRGVTPLPRIVRAWSNVSGGRITWALQVGHPPGESLEIRPQAFGFFVAQALWGEPGERPTFVPPEWDVIGRVCQELAPGWAFLLPPFGSPSSDDSINFSAPLFMQCAGIARNVDAAMRRPVEIVS